MPVFKVYSPDGEILEPRSTLPADYKEAYAYFRKMYGDEIHIDGPSRYMLILQPRTNMYDCYDHSCCLPDPSWSIIDKERTTADAFHNIQYDPFETASNKVTQHRTPTRVSVWYKSEFDEAIAAFLDLVSMD